MSKEGQKAELTLLVIYQDDLPVCRQSPIQTVTSWYTRQIYWETISHKRRSVTSKGQRSCTTLGGKPIEKLWSIICHMVSHCYLPPDKVNVYLSASK